MDGSTAYSQALFALELACQYLIHSPNNKNLQNLKFYLQETFRVFIAGGVDLRFLYNNCIFQDARELLISYKDPVTHYQDFTTQNKNNVVYLTK